MEGILSLSLICILLFQCLLCTESWSVLVMSTRKSSTSSQLYASKSQGKGRRSPSRTASGFGPAASADDKKKPLARSLGPGRPGQGTRPLRSAALAYDALKEKGCQRADVYIVNPKSPANKDLFWYVGKVAFSGEATADDAISAQKRLILEHGRALRPGDLASERLQVWRAPGDSEMDVVRNLVTLTKAGGCSGGEWDLEDVGFDPEVYVGDERTEGGLRVRRDPETGEPLRKPFEVNLAPQVPS